VTSSAPEALNSNRRHTALLVIGSILLLEILVIIPVNNDYRQQAREEKNRRCEEHDKEPEHGGILASRVF